MKESAAARWKQAITWLILAAAGRILWRDTATQPALARGARADGANSQSARDHREVRAFTGEASRRLPG